MKHVKRGRRCVQCNRRLGSKAEFLFNRPDGSRVFLCGRKRCTDDYNGVAPNERRADERSADLETLRFYRDYEFEQADKFSTPGSYDRYVRADLLLCEARRAGPAA